MRQPPVYSPNSLLAALVAFILIFSGGELHALILNVPADYSGIQGAIDAAADGDTVLVSPGTYYENISFKRKDIVVTSRFMYDMDPTYIANTIINGSTPANPDSASVVRIRGIGDSTIVLQGFTITGGKGTKLTTYEAGGKIATLGGGIFIDTASPTIQYNLIIDNEALDSVSTLAAGGGGIRTGYGKPVIRNNMILSNRGLYGAGIVFNFPTGGRVINNVIADNIARNSFGGGAMWLGAGYGISIINNTIVNNSSLYSTGGIDVVGAGLVIKNTILWGNTGPLPNQISGGPTVTYSNIQGGQLGTGNIAVDPRLHRNYRYHLSSSPCIDAGDPASIPYDDKENPANPGSAKWPSRGLLRNDIGAYGGPGAFSFSKIFAYLERNGIANVPCTVSVEAYTSGTITDLHWDFGDGSPEYNLITSHVFPAWGTYPFALKGDTGLGTLNTLYQDTAFALADSLIASVSAAAPDQPVSVEISARNAPPLYSIVVPLEWSGDLQLQFDSVSRVGCRTDFFNVMSFVSYDSGSHRIAVKLQNTLSGNGPELSKGTGTVLRFWFTVPKYSQVGQTALISLAGYGTQQPSFKSSLLLYPSTLTYNPLTVPGSITALSCCLARGDANYDSQHKRNVLDVTYLVAYLFQGGDNPPCGESADVNGDAKINVIDITNLVQYLFKHGAPPPACP